MFIQNKYAAKAALEEVVGTPCQGQVWTPGPRGHSVSPRGSRGLRPGVSSLPHPAGSAPRQTPALGTELPLPLCWSPCGSARLAAWLRCPLPGQLAVLGPRAVRRVKATSRHVQQTPATGLWRASRLHLGTGHHAERWQGGNQRRRWRSEGSPRPRLLLQQLLTGGPTCVDLQRVP